MHRIDTAHSLGNLFVDESPSVVGTEVSAAWLNDLQESLIKVLTEAGLDPIKGDWDQYHAALKSLFGAGPGRAEVYFEENADTTEPPNLRGWLEVNGATAVIDPGLNLTWNDNYGRPDSDPGYFYEISVDRIGNGRVYLSPGIMVGSPSAPISSIEKTGTTIRVRISDLYDLSPAAVQAELLAHVSGVDYSPNSGVYTVTAVNPVAGDKYIEFKNASGSEQINPGGNVSFFRPYQDPDSLPVLIWNSNKNGYYSRLFSNERVAGIFRPNETGIISIYHALGTGRRFGASHIKEPNDLLKQTFFYFTDAEEKDPSPDFPAIRVAEDHVLDADNFEPLVRFLRKQYIKIGSTFEFQTSGYDDDAGNTRLQLVTNADNQSFADGMLGDAIYHGSGTPSYNNWRTITLLQAIGSIPAGTYDLLDVDNTPGTLQLTIDYNYPGGSTAGTIRCFPFRLSTLIDPDGTKARWYAADDSVIQTPGGDAIPLLRVLDRMQGHIHDIDTVAAGNAGALASDQRNAGTYSVTTTLGPITDGVNGTPRTGQTTRGRGLVMHKYLYAKSYRAAA